ncbi:MAG: Lacal_2735 family protein [Flavobacteriaceae bacterium]|nr:Lacal_2735 family protein [Flavobacteriaceae bacterium]
MFKLFKGKSEVEKLQKKYETLMAEWHKLSTIDRAKSDAKFSEAQTVLDKIEALQKAN